MFQWGQRVEPGFELTFHCLHFFEMGRLCWQESHFHSPFLHLGNLFRPMRRELRNEITQNARLCRKLHWRGRPRCEVAIGVGIEFLNTKRSPTDGAQIHATIYVAHRRRTIESVLSSSCLTRRLKKPTVVLTTTPNERTHNERAQDEHFCLPSGFILLFSVNTLKKLLDILTMVYCLMLCLDDVCVVERHNSCFLTVQRKILFCSSPTENLSVSKKRDCIYSIQHRSLCPVLRRHLHRMGFLPDDALFAASFHLICTFVEGHGITRTAA